MYYYYLGIGRVQLDDLCHCYLDFCDDHLTAQKTERQRAAIYYLGIGRVQLVLGRLEEG